MRWGYRPIYDRMIPNDTLSAVMHKEDKISHKTRKHCHIKNQADQTCNILDEKMSKSDLQSCLSAVEHVPLVEFYSLLVGTSTSPQ